DPPELAVEQLLLEDHRAAIRAEDDPMQMLAREAREDERSAIGPARDERGPARRPRLARPALEDGVQEALVAGDPPDGRPADVGRPARLAERPPHLAVGTDLDPSAVVCVPAAAAVEDHRLVHAPPAAVAQAHELVHVARPGAVRVRDVDEPVARELRIDRDPE